MEMTMGLYWLTQKMKKKAPIVFATMAEAKDAYRDGRIDVNDPILVKG
jgi:hypothetical protein